MNTQIKHTQQQQQQIQLTQLKLEPMQMQKQDINLDVTVNGDVDTNEVHVRVFQRKSNKYICTIEGLSKDSDFKKLVKQMKDEFHCNGSFTTDGIIQLQGDHRKVIKEFLTKKKLGKKIKVHGF